LIASLVGTAYGDTAVVNGAGYYYIVAGVNALGDGTNSAEASAVPSLAASLRAWFKADALAGLADGAAVTDWQDLSGAGNDAAQANVIQQPVLVRNALNGWPVVRFNAANSNYLAFTRPVQDDFTIFCLFRSTQGLGSGNLYYQGAGLVNGEVAGETVDFGSCLFSNGAVCAGTGNPDVAVNSAAGFNDGAPHLMTFKRTESTGEVDLYMDGALAGTTSGSTSPLTATDRLVLGAQQTMLNFLSGDIAEVKIFNSALGDTDRAAQETSLMYKWGIRATPALALANINAGSKSLTIDWPATAGGWQLCYATNLNPPIAWQPVTNTIASNNMELSVTVPADSVAKYFRLVGQ
jgi:hypothetical protein